MNTHAHIYQSRGAVMAYVLVFFAGVLLTLLVREKGARRLLVLVVAIGALFGGAAYAGAQPDAGPAPAPSTTVPAPPLGNL